MFLAKQGSRGKVVLSGAVLLTLCAGVAYVNQPRNYVEDAWYRGVPPELHPFVGPDKVDESLVHKVSTGSEKQAEVLLQKTPAVKVSDQSASQMTGLNLKAPSGRSFYLVRGVDAMAGSSDFEAFARNKQLLIQSGAMGSGRPESTKQAVVVALDALPKEVFTTFSVDQ